MKIEDSFYLHIQRFPSINKRLNSMTYSGMRDVLGNKNELASRLVKERNLSLQRQVTPAYNPEPIYPSRIRHDPQPDRNLPNMRGVNQVVTHTPMAGKQVNVDAKGNRIDYNSVDSGIRDLVGALTGVDGTNYRNPLPEKPIQQRNSVGSNGKNAHTFQSSGYNPHDNPSKPVRQRNKIGR